MGNPLRQPLVAAALGEAATLSFTVHVFPPHKSNQGMEIKGKQPEGWKRDPGRGCRRGKGTKHASDVLTVS